ncbi:TPA: hypothetical protein KRE09_003644 [Clostridioides difficile]|uniref:hypothetical protein n=2 Tax=Clostridioides difficile TaxID=1496 RepID=UPI0005AAC8FD|nr:hypothetical protein [Clostridioides difficile]NJJ73233.1 hypothetical protein [Clostridioides difficile]SKA34237.1 Uncharacterised protein [Clostridioides difficile]VFG22044.1 Uncharacterised protein [Clostridioides difficile]HBF5897958.1 hypothetical protein [Clostridioides difficile]HBG5613349.1 hypothetical protein [Clostridioides difficile]
MLDSNSKKILSFLKPFAIESDHIDFSTEQIHENLPSLSLNEIGKAIKFLNENNYLISRNCIASKYPIVWDVTSKGLNFEEFEPKNQSQNINQTFNIQNMQNSAVGNTGSVTINNGIDFSDLREFIDTNKNLTQAEKYEAQSIVDLIESTSENNIPLKKGFLSRFGDILNKHPDLAMLIAQTLLNRFLIQ